MTLGYDCGFQRVKAKDGQHHFIQYERDLR